MPRIGVYICRCGGNISDVVDVEAVRDAASKWDGVVTAKVETYLCSKPSQDVIFNDIKEYKLDRVIVASCTPRMHLTTFQSVLKRAGLNPYMLEFVNIREHCSWVHGPPPIKPEATEKAISLVRGGYERSLKLEALEPITEKCSRDVLVIGGGIAGIMASLELGNMGHHVYLVERYPSIGGHMAKLTKVFPTLDCAQCILTPRMAEVGRHPNITLITNAEVEQVKGFPGNYQVKVRVKPRGVDPEKCTGCGICVQKCPWKTFNEFEEYRSMRKAIYIPFPQAVPYAAAIDFQACKKCGVCVKLCPRGAIDLEDKGRELDLNVGAIIVATGYDLFDIKKFEEYGYGVYKDVVTMLELERLTSLFGPTGGHVKRFSDGGEVKRLAIVLCAGSRDTERGKPYCSRICCMYSIKQAVLLKEQFGIDVWIYYIDVRATGRGYEELYRRAQQEGVVFVKGKVAEVRMDRGSGKLIVRAENTLLGRVIEEKFDMVALAVAMTPALGLSDLARLMRLPLGEDGFVQEKHPKLDPVDSLVSGIYACGCTLGPKDVRDTVSDALGAAAKASSFLGAGYVTTSPEKPVVRLELCDGCGACIKVCPSGAISPVDGKVKVDPFLCIGCGACIPECPRDALDFKNATWEQIVATIRGVLAGKKPDEVRVVAFVDKTIAYTGLDFLGLDRAHYPVNVRVVAVPSTAILGLKHILYAFASGADGIAVVEGNHEVYEKYVEQRMRKVRAALRKYRIEGARLLVSLTELPAYKKVASIFEELTSMVKQLKPIPEEARNAIRKELGLGG
ncbi:MAG: 4Fe-4S binding protein [Candidatus Nezhaarchaeales archaeon]